MTGWPPFGAWLKARRKALDLRQEDLAFQVGCSFKTIEKIESGERRPSRQVAELLAAELGVPADEREAFVRYARLAGQYGRTTAEPAPSPDTSPWRAFLYGFTNLPALPVALIGREKDLEAVCGLLRREGVRLVTLVGAPGIGKTSLAVEAAGALLGSFEDGVFFVGLAPITDPGLVAGAVATALGVTQSGNRPVEDALVDHLREKRLLLVLDNFEQVAGAAPLVADLLAGCRWLKVLATSRQPLHLRGERQYAVPPLDTPDPSVRQDVATLARFPAVALFVERASAVRSDFTITEENADAVARICARLAGLPLAIELAAARIKLFSPQTIASHLESRLQLPLLVGGSRDLPARQQTLHAAIEWSYGLLDRGEQTLFRRMGVFAGGCTAAGVEAVCNAAGDLPPGALESLADKSLVEQDEAGSGEEHFSMLEMIHEYAAERLEESEEAGEIRRVHAGYYLALAESGDKGLRGPDQTAWLARLDSEQDNMRAVFAWAEKNGEVDHGLRLAGALAWYWELRGYFSEAQERVSSMLAQPGAEKSTQGRARALNAAGRLAQLEIGVAEPLLRESLAIAREVGDKWGMVSALHNLGNVATNGGDLASARRYHEESLAIAREMDHRWGIAWGLMGVGHVALSEHNYAAARSRFEESLAARKQIGDRWGIARSLNELGDVTYLQGDYATARARYEESLAIHSELGHKGFMEVVLLNLARVAHAEGDLERARRLYAESLDLFREQGKRVGIGLCLTGLASSAYAQGDLERAARTFGAAEALLEAAGYRLDPVDSAAFDRPMAEVRSHKELTAMWAQGRIMPLEEAIRYALEGAADPQHTPHE